MEAPRLTLVLEIDPTTTPVAGTVSEPSGAAQPFTGWTQLGHTLDMAITLARERAAVVYDAELAPGIDAGIGPQIL